MFSSRQFLRLFIPFGVVLFMLFVWTIRSADASSVVSQTWLSGDCIPQFAVQMPVFGPAAQSPE